MPITRTSGIAAITRTPILIKLLKSVIFKSPIPRKYPCMPLVAAGSIYINEIRRRYLTPCRITSSSLTNRSISGRASIKHTAKRIIPYMNSSTIPHLKPSFIRFFSLAPLF